MASMGSFVVTYRSIHRDETGKFISEVYAGGLRSVSEMADDTANLAKMFAPKLTGFLAGSIQAVKMGFHAETIANAPWAEPQEEGAGPHLIPNSFFGITVAHPGNPAVHYMARAGEAVAAHSAAIIRANMPGL